MNITSLRLADFRTFRKREFRFSPGMNVLRGPNESGKSTVVRAIVAALFEKPNADNVFTRSDLRWGSEERPVLEMEFEHEGTEYRLVKDFRLRTVVLEEYGGTGELTTSKAVQDKMSGILGLGDPAQFMRTACVTHDQMTKISGDASGSRKLAGMLRDVVAGEREGASLEDAVRTLDSKIEELKRGLEHPAGNPGTIARLQKEREELIVRQKELAGDISESDDGMTRLREVKRLLDEQERRLVNLKELLDKNLEAVDLERRVEESRRRFEFADRAIDAGKALAGIEAELQSKWSEFSKLGADADVELEKEMEVRRSLGVLIGELQDERSPGEGEPPGRQSTLAGWIAVTVGIVLAALGVTLTAINTALLVLLAPGILMMAAGVFLLLKKGGSGGREGLVSERIARGEQEVAKLEAREKRFLESVGCASTGEFLARFESYGALVSERDRAAAGAEALLGDRTVQEVSRERTAASLEFTACEAKLDELEPYRLPPGRLEEITGELQELRGMVERLRNERDGLEFHLAKTRTDPEEKLRIEENLASLWEAEQNARRRLRVFTLARDAMKEVSGCLLSAAIPALAGSVGKTLAVLTDGRYDTVEVRESDLAMSVYSGERGDMIPVQDALSSLSKGTVSQIYLAARLHLVDMLTGGRRPPLLFDDSFSYFDDDRLERLWNILLEAARDRQVFLFTCCSRYDGLIGEDVNVIDLQ